MSKLFKDKKVTIMGLGLNGGGVGAAKFFVKEGAQVLITDKKSREDLKKSLDRLKGRSIKYVLGLHRGQDFTDADLIIQNPAVPSNSPFIELASRNNIEIDTDLGIFFDYCENRVIGITGTKGKSTTTRMVFGILKEHFKNVLLAGNMGRSPLDILRQAMNDRKATVVLELSSSQLEILAKKKKSPNLSVITNIFPDHLNRYQKMTKYLAVKKLIFKHQKSGDILLLNYDNPDCRKFAVFAKSRVWFFSKKKLEKNSRLACWEENGLIFFKDEKDPVVDFNDLGFFGEHNLYNALAAVACAKLLKVPSSSIRKAFKKLKGLPGREEISGEIRGVRYINDTAATMPEACVAALKSFSTEYPSSKIVLIAGGEDKNLKYKKLAVEISRKAAGIILLPGSATEKLKKELKIKSNRPPMALASNLDEAVRQAGKWARKGDLVIFSPAAASFNLFKNEFDRGDKFNEAVERIRNGGKAKKS